jgi:hypothetical protein
MLEILYQVHSGWRYIVILVAVVAFAKLLIGLASNSAWGQLDQRLGAALPIVMDIQVLLGAVLWIAQQRWLANTPLQSWEHPATMLVAVAVAHITWSRAKKASSDAARFRMATIGYAVAGLLLAIGIMRITGMLGAA